MSTQPEPAEATPMQVMTQPDTDSLPIYEVARELGLAQHVMRMWESRFPQLRPVRGQGGRRYYRPHDIAVLRQIADLLYVRKLSVAQAQAELGQEGLATDPSPMIGVAPEGAGVHAASADPVMPVPPVADWQAGKDAPDAVETPAQIAHATVTVEQVTIVEETVETIQAPDDTAPAAVTSDPVMPAFVAPQDMAPEDAPAMAPTEDGTAPAGAATDEDDMPLEQIVMIELERLQGENTVLRESLRGVLVELQALRDMVPV